MIAKRATRTVAYEGKSAFGLETYAAFRAFNRFSKTMPQRRNTKLGGGASTALSPAAAAARSRNTERS